MNIAAKVSAKKQRVLRAAYQITIAICVLNSYAARHAIVYIKLS